MGLKALVTTKVEKPLQLRGIDGYGSGAYRASRGARLHNGLDFKLGAGDTMLSPVEGIVTKLGYPYAKHLEYRYVEVSNAGLRHRFFYISPLLELNDKVSIGDELGISQDLSLVYPKMVNHIHYEIMDESGGYLDPGDFVG